MDDAFRGRQSGEVSYEDCGVGGLTDWRQGGHECGRALGKATRSFEIGERMYWCSKASIQAMCSLIYFPNVNDVLSFVGKREHMRIHVRADRANHRHSSVS